MAKISTKRIKIDKANATIMAFVGTAAFVVAFSLVASKALLSQRSYQARVIGEKTKALKQLKANKAAADQLVASYSSFQGESINILGGNSVGTGEHDGDNAKIVLDALPSKYDFPALATSIEKLIGTAYKTNSIEGTDDEVNQSQQASDSQPIEMPFEISVTGNFGSIQDLIGVFQRSIRPIYITKLSLSGSDNNLTAEVSAKTYYQPENKLDITAKEIK
jgi:Tfp pilus assembly protein PilO